MSSSDGAMTFGRGRFGRRGLTVLGCAVVAFTGPRLAGPSGSVAYTVTDHAIIVATLALAGVGAWRHRRSLGLPGFLIFFGLLAVLLGDAMLWVQQHVLHSEAYPNWADALYQSAYLFLGGATLTVIRRRSPGRNVGALLDAATLAVGAGVVAYSFSIASIAQDSTASLAAKVVSSLYPLFDVMLVGVIARLLFGSAGRRGAVLFLAGGLVCELTGDVGFNAAVYAGTQASLGTWIDSLYLMFGALLAFSLWQSDTDLLVAPANDQDRLGWVRIAALATGALLAPVTLLVQDANGNDQNVRAVAIGAMILFVLTLVRVSLLVRAVEAASLQLARQARTDSLTGLANRRTFEFELGRAMRGVLDAAQEGRTRVLSVGIIDIDHFKRFNDTYGHGRGDELLRECAAHWTGTLNQLAPTAVMARYGGEEFVVVFRDLGSEAAATVLRRLIQVTPMEQTFSGGVATWDGSESALDLLNRADTRLYAAKHAGRRAVFSQETPTQPEAAHVGPPAPSG